MQQNQKTPQSRSKGQKMGAGKLKERLTFSKLADTIDDGYGNVQQGWQDQFTVNSRVRPRLGGEEVMAARLQGKNLVAITLRSSVKTKQITTNWRAVDARSGEQYNIRSVIETEDKEYIELLGEKGVAI
jgi:SPP1 family predicted phage head-tail adaptor